MKSKENQPIKTMSKGNKFKQARYHSRSIKTIGDCIDALVEAFSGDDSADIIGCYILERAAEKAKERLPARQAEHEALMARVKESLANRN